VQKIVIVEGTEVSQATEWGKRGSSGVVSATEGEVKETRS
jgi:hypothetical protein